MNSCCSSSAKDEEVKGGMGRRINVGRNFGKPATEGWQGGENRKSSMQIEIEVNADEIFWSICLSVSGLCFAFHSEISCFCWRWSPTNIPSSKGCLVEVTNTGTCRSSEQSVLLKQSLFAWPWTSKRIWCYRGWLLIFSMWGILKSQLPMDLFIYFWRWHLFTKLVFTKKQKTALQQLLISYNFSNV